MIIYEVIAAAYYFHVKIGAMETKWLIRPYCGSWGLNLVLNPIIFLLFLGWDFNGPFRILLYNCTLIQWMHLICSDTMSVLIMSSIHHCHWIHMPEFWMSCIFYWLWKFYLMIYFWEENSVKKEIFHFILLSVFQILNSVTVYLFKEVIRKHNIQIMCLGYRNFLFPIKSRSVLNQWGGSQYVLFWLSKLFCLLASTLILAFNFIVGYM
jgi:hypothetical protein